MVWVGPLKNRWVITVSHSRFSFITLKSRRLSLKAEFVIGIFVGGALSSLAQDFSDYAYFYAASQGWLTSVLNQLFFWYYAPFLYYGLFALVAYFVGRFTKFSPAVVLWVFLGAVIISAILSGTLPQFSSPYFQASLLLATAVSVGLVVGSIHEAAKFK